MANPFPANPPPGFFSKRTIAASPELHRVRNLPRRTWTDEHLEDLATKLTALLKTPEGTMRLRPKQALALHDAGICNGLVGSLRVGGGKTLISMLAPRVMHPAPERPLLILPAALVEKTEADRHNLSKHWKIARNLYIRSFEFLGRIAAEKFFEEFDPDLIIIDEAHRAKNKRAGVTRRLIRHMHRRPNTRVIILSGTVVKKSLKDAAHLIRWALKDNAPIPREDGELEEWADALDEGVNVLRRVDPGPLVTLAGIDRTGDPLVDARRAFRQRLSETPGFVETTGDQVACSLNISVVRYPEHPVTNQHFETLRAKWETPDGWMESEAVAIWRHARELSLGFHYVWDPRPPKAWLDARRAWAKFVRDTLSRSRTLDTELQVVNAVKSGALRSPEFYTWSEIRPSFTPVQRALWHDDSALEKCQEWMEEHDGIVWCEHTFFAEELSRRSGVPYFGAQGRTAAGESIVDFASSEKAGKVPIIASIAANATGRNLQAWNKNLVTTGITQAADWEQLLGRTHRDGQKADEVFVEALLGCFEHWDAWNRAKAYAVATQDTYGADQKLLIATVDMPSEEEILALQGARWKKVVQIKSSIPFAM